MNYQKIYNQIIKQASNRVLVGYKERHHIIPKSIGGINDASNLVDLTAREHFICHMLLCEIYPNESKLKYALWAMVNQNSPKQERTYKVSGRLYERLKQAISVEQSKKQQGVRLSQQTKCKMSQTRTGQKKTAYKSKELKFEHICTTCNSQYKSADIKGVFCNKCKEPRLCKCGCGVTVKTPGKLFARGCKTRGKSYIEIYNSVNPTNGFKKGNKFGKYNKQGYIY